MNHHTILRLCTLFIILLVAEACTTANYQVLTENPRGNYTANVRPGGR